MTVALVAVPVAVAVIPPGDEVTVYPLIWDPPLEAGAVQVTVAWEFPGVAGTLVGALGGVAAALNTTLLISPVGDQPLLTLHLPQPPPPTTSPPPPTPPYQPH